MLLEHFTSNKRRLLTPLSTCAFCLFSSLSCLYLFPPPRTFYVPLPQTHSCSYLTKGVTSRASRRESTPIICCPFDFDLFALRQKKGDIGVRLCKLYNPLQYLHRVFAEIFHVPILIGLVCTFAVSGLTNSISLTMLPFFSLGPQSLPLPQNLKLVMS